MEVDGKGNVVDRRIVEGVIRSSYKLSYTTVSKILDGDSQTRKQYAPVVELIELCAELTRILQEMRDKKGNISLDVKEAKIIFENNEIKIPDYERLFSYQIIEAFMVLANETVAEYMHSIEAPFVYRIHEKPSEEKAATFRAFAQTLGINARFSIDDIKPYDYQKILKNS